MLPGAAPLTTLQLFLGGLHVATIEERTSLAVVERTSRLVGSSDDVARLRVSLDDSGFPQEARYQRRGPRGNRDVTLLWNRHTTTLRTEHGAHVLGAEERDLHLEMAGRYYRRARLAGAQVREALRTRVTKLAQQFPLYPGHEQW